MAGGSAATSKPGRSGIGDDHFPRDAERPFKSGAKVTIRLWLKDGERANRRVRNSILQSKRKEA